MNTNYLKTFRKAVQQSPECDTSVTSDQRVFGNKLPSGVRSLETLVSQIGDCEKPFTPDFTTIERRCPDYVDQGPWQRAVEDGRRFLAQWGDQALALGWTGEELFGLHTPPADPHPSYNRLSRYDCTGLVWMLVGNPVVALTEATAAIQHKSSGVCVPQGRILPGSITIYRKERKPAFGPVGDSLDDFV
jgi:hypothetical protein